MGRPPKYKPKYCRMLLNYFDIEHYYTTRDVKTNKKNQITVTERTVPNDLPLFTEFSTSIGVSKKSLVRWVEKYEKFRAAYEMAKDMQRSMLVQNGLRGLYNASYVTFISKNILGMRDNPEEKRGDEKPKPIKIEYVKVDASKN